MLVVVIISLVMLGNRNFGKTIALSGILAGILLLAGDLTVGVRSNVITILFSIGYALLILWFFLMANIFFHLDRKVASIQFASKT